MALPPFQKQQSIDNFVAKKAHYQQTDILTKERQRHLKVLDRKCWQPFVSKQIVLHHGTVKMTHWGSDQ